MGRTGSETVLLYNLDNDKGRRIKVILVQMGMKIRSVKKDEYAQAVGTLLSISPETGKEAVETAMTSSALREASEVPEDFEEEMMVLYGFTDSRLNQFLMRMRKAKIEKVALKAIVTPTNRSWNGLELYAELKKEHEAMSGK